LNFLRRSRVKTVEPIYAVGKDDIDNRSSQGATGIAIRDPRPLGLAELSCLLFRHGMKATLKDNIEFAVETGKKFLDFRFG